MEKFMAILAALFVAGTLSACEAPEAENDGDDAAEGQSDESGQDSDGEDDEG